MGDLIYPPFGYAAVVEGAVRHLQQPSTIHKRVSNMTYGVRVFLNWTRDMPESYKQWDTYYKAYVTDKAFLVAVKKGEPVEVGGLRGLRVCVWGEALGVGGWRALQLVTDMGEQSGVSRVSDVLGTGTAQRCSTCCTQALLLLFCQSSARGSDPWQSSATHAPAPPPPDMSATTTA